MARNYPKQFEDPDEILKEPVTLREFDRIIEKNWDILKKNATESTLDQLDDSLDTITARQEKAGEQHRAVIEQFGDDNSNSELVYAIFTDSATKRVIVAFRGSTTAMDWKKDLQVWLHDAPNPYYGKERNKNKKQYEILGIHNGFYAYLLDAQDNEGVKNKYEVIIDEAVEVLKRNPGYKLFVTGHSLGAALSSLFAFYASSVDEIPRPVTCVSIASPYVGDHRFRRAFRLAEAQGQIRYLRVANQRDIVSIEPFLSLRGSLYKHVGVQLKLYPGSSGSYSLSYPKRYAIFWNLLKRAWMNSLFANLSLNYLRNHGTAEYNKRLEVEKLHLENIFLNDLYAEKSFIGTLMPNELMPNEEL